jgi:hypothetical protein
MRTGAGWRRRGWLACAGLVFAFAPLAPAFGGQNQAKNVHGRVLDAGTSPLPGAIIYLQDQKTAVVKTLIARADGSYRFAELPADTDYRVWAEYKGKRTKDKQITSFDTKLDVTQDFHIAP